MKVSLGWSPLVSLLVVVTLMTGLLLALGDALRPQVALCDTELTYNGGFESGTDGWGDVYPSAATFTTTTSPVHSGNRAASLDKANGATSYTYFSQYIGVNAGQYYTLGGWAYGNPTYYTNVHVRLKWLDSSGGTISTVDATPNADAAAWQSQTTGSIQAPVGAVTAKIDGYAYVSTGHTTSSPVYFDDISFTTSGPTAVTLSSLTVRTTASQAPSFHWQWLTLAGAVGLVLGGGAVARRWLRR